MRNPTSSFHFPDHPQPRHATSHCHKPVSADESLIGCFKFQVTVALPELPVQLVSPSAKEKIAILPGGIPQLPTQKYV